MPEYREKTFEGKEVHLDGSTFTGCTFRDCRLMFEATALPDLGANRFEGKIQLAFHGKAGMTMQLLMMIYQRGGKSGAEAVEYLFNVIRHGGPEGDPEGRLGH
jgi:hypothetical protein